MKLTFSAATGFMLLLLLANGCTHQAQNDEKPAPPSSPLSLLLSANAGEFHLKVTSSFTGGGVVCVHPEIMTLTLKNQNGEEIQTNPGYKRSPPLNEDWHFLEKGASLSVPIYPQQEYSGREDGKYTLKIKLNPVSKVPSEIKQWFKSEKIWSGPATESNEIEVSVKDQKWR